MNIRLGVIICQRVSSAKARVENIGPSGLVWTYCQDCEEKRGHGIRQILNFTYRGYLFMNNKLLTIT